MVGDLARWSYVRINNGGHGNGRPTKRQRQNQISWLIPAWLRPRARHLPPESVTLITFAPLHRPKAELHFCTSATFRLPFTSDSATPSYLA